jgi:hypothetical protein
MHKYDSLCFSSDQIGINCTESFDPCDPNPCANGGTCEKSYDGHYFQCNCPTDPEYGGLTCEGKMLGLGTRLPIGIKTQNRQ